MDAIDWWHPSWSTTFPHLVTPKPDEWLPGLLLRCDEVNHWDSGTTVAHLRRAVYPHLSKSWFNVIAPKQLHLRYLSELLALSPSATLALTYQSEMERLSDIGDRHPRIHRLLLQAQTSFRFSLCPECVADSRILPRSLMLPHLTVCQKHSAVLQTTCQCGSKLRLFSGNTAPFTCSACRVSWGKLPRIKASSEHLDQTRQISSYYTWFFSLETSELLVRVLRHLEVHGMEYDKEESFVVAKGKWKPSQPISRPYARGVLALGNVVSSLLRLNLSLDEIFKDVDLLSSHGPMHGSSFL